jgi:hypothetical protein
MLLSISDIKGLDNRLAVFNRYRDPGGIIVNPPYPLIPLINLFFKGRFCAEFVRNRIFEPVIEF